jgi:hypothetical protein
MIDIYIDASCNKTIGIAGMYIPALDTLEFKYYYDNVSSTKVELAGFEDFMKELPELVDNGYNIHTDCQKLANSVPLRDDITFIKEVGHGPRDTVTKEFKFIDKATRKELRRLVKSNNL